ncbi:hypothetical protein TanjilG_24304 [Lupinus angustifolius]|uniref:WIBG Mago-binding domain-containing protein n=1 Tax=Lupinus angustifolius TaxID=3871 RepID=A0A394DBU9_LUPAN|nr:PREDICTED: partner of Y14 and mago-like [Lupinus angustifolius]OIW20836.1 hypothetical protein TanjilG_24304 [Lupinus angustifolius]
MSEKKVIEEEEERKQNQISLEDLSKNLKEGERIVGPTRRPDGTLRKPFRIRAGHVPQDEIAIYQSKGALWKKEMASQVGPPGYGGDGPALDAKPKTKSVKRNERKKEKRIQAALEKDKDLEPTAAEDSAKQVVSIINSGHTSESVKSLTTQISEIAVSGNSSIVTPTSDSVDGSSQIDPIQDIDKRIRALKKKIRLKEEAQQKTAAKDLKAEQLDKLTKLEDWRKELKLLEDKRAETAAAS